MTINRTVTITAVIVFVASVTLYIILTENDRKAVRDTLDLYIKAVRDRNFETVYQFNAATQKHLLFIEHGTAVNRDGLLREAYDEQKALFDLTESVFVVNVLWGEKPLFIPDMDYTIKDVVMERDIDNPTAFYIKRINATAEVEVEYRNSDTAPVFEGKGVKRAVYLIKMIHIRNIVKAVRLKSSDDKWLFKGIAIKRGSVVYWQL